MPFLTPHWQTEGPLGLPMLDKQAQQLDALLKGLPQDDLHAPGKLTIEKATTELLPGERADVSWISTEDIDRYKDVVRAAGMDDAHFRLNPVVTLQHAYWLPPVGRSLWRKKVRDGDRLGIKAKTVYPTRPDSLPDGADWLPDEAFPLVQAGLLNGKSIGFIPTKARHPTDKEAEQGIRRVVEEWLLLEYACCYLPCNQTSVVEAVSKGLLIPEPVQKALGIDLAALPPPAPQPEERSIGFTPLTQIERHIERRLAAIDFEALAQKVWKEGYDRARGRPTTSTFTGTPSTSTGNRVSVGGSDSRFTLSPYPSPIRVTPTPTTSANRPNTSSARGLALRASSRVQVRDSSICATLATFNPSASLSHAALPGRNGDSANRGCDRGETPSRNIAQTPIRSPMFHGVWHRGTQGEWK